MDSLAPPISPTQAAQFRRDVAALVPDLRAFARFLVRDRAAADDLVQDAIVRALDASAQFAPNFSLRNWLFAILRNLFFEQTRRRRIEQRVLADQVPLTQAAPAAQDGQAALSELQRFLWALPAISREALVLVGAQGMSYAEAASICGVAEGTMKARVSRARLELTRRMAGAVVTTEPRASD